MKPSVGTCIAHELAVGRDRKGIFIFTSSRIKPVVGHIRFSVKPPKLGFLSSSAREFGHVVFCPAMGCGERSPSRRRASIPLCWEGGGRPLYGWKPLWLRVRADFRGPLAGRSLGTTHASLLVVAMKSAPPAAQLV